MLQVWASDHLRGGQVPRKRFGALLPSLSMPLQHAPLSSLLTHPPARLFNPLSIILDSRTFRVIFSLCLRAVVCDKIGNSGLMKLVGLFVCLMWICRPLLDWICASISSGAGRYTFVSIRWSQHPTPHGERRPPMSLHPLGLWLRSAPPPVLFTLLALGGGAVEWQG